MKKLIIAVAIVCATAYAQAATISWSSTSFTDLPTCTNPDGVGYADEGPACVTAYLWTFTAANWNSAYETSQGVYDAYKAGTLAVGDSATAEWIEGVAYFDVSATTAGTSYSDGTQYYAAALFLHDDGDGVDYYIGNWATELAADSGANVDDLGNTIGGSSAIQSGGSAVTWASVSSGDVPEPTSGILVLLGIAGLALRRRQA